jgi:hypothetical protein
VMYIAIGGKSLWQPRRSIASLRFHCPDITVALFTNQPADACPPVDYRLEVSATGGYHVKPRFIPWLPFNRTLYLDADTVVLHPSAVEPLGRLTGQYGLG